MLGTPPTSSKQVTSLQVPSTLDLPFYAEYWYLYDVAAPCAFPLRISAMPADTTNDLDTNTPNAECWSFMTLKPSGFVEK